MIIRRAGKTDVPALCRLMQHVQSIHGKAHPESFVAELDPEATAKFFDEVLSNDRNLIFLADVSDAVIGYLWCEERFANASFARHAAHTGYIHHISVDPAHRRRGVGKALVNEALSELKARGTTRVGVDHWSFNHRARSLFKKLGFTRRREIYTRDMP